METNIREKLLKNFPFTPTSDQEKLIEVVNDYFNDQTQRKCFVLKGYAGTGKTSFIKTLVKTLPDVAERERGHKPVGASIKLHPSWNRSAAARASARTPSVSVA